MPSRKIDFSHLQSITTCLEYRDELLNSGRLKEIKEEIASVDKTQKKVLGKELNILRAEIQLAFENRVKEIQTELEKDDFLDFDPTFYAESYYAKNTGDIHPVVLVTQEIVEIFQKMGFSVADGPLVESQTNCFTKLNMPSYHPARAMQDTFYLAQKDDLNENYVLRTHTSSVQIRYGNSHEPPIYIVSPGQVYRNENIDATHDIMFHQIECLVIDKNVSLGHLKTLIETFFGEFFGDSGLQVRLRANYFPYTVPSMEIDIENPFQKNKSEQIDWLEVGGSGLVHPQVIENMGIDSSQYQGLAFGFGLERMTMLKLGLSKLNQFFNSNLDFLAGKKI